MAEGAEPEAACLTDDQIGMIVEDTVDEMAETMEVNVLPKIGHDVGTESTTNSTFFTEPEQTSTINYDENVVEETRKSYVLAKLGPSNEDVEMAFQDIIKKGILPLPYVKNALIQKLNKERLVSLMQSDYRNTERYDKALSLIDQNDRMAGLNELTKKKETWIAERHTSLENQKWQINSEFDTKIKRAQDASQQRYYELNVKHLEQVEQFKKKWQDPDFLKQFNRPSTKLINLRQMERKLAVVNRFKDAREIKAMGDEQQRIEEAEMQQVIDEEMKKDFAKMREMQQKEVDTLMRREEELIESLELQRTRQLEAITAALKLKETKKKPPLNRRMRSVPDDLIKGKMRKGEDEQKPASPVVYKKMAQFRCAKTGDLNLLSIDDNMLAKLTRTDSNKKNTKRTKSSLLPRLSE